MDLAICSCSKYDGTRHDDRRDQTTRSCSLHLITRLSVTCFLFVCVILVIQVHDHYKNSKLFALHRRTLRQSLQVDLNTQEFLTSLSGSNAFRLAVKHSGLQEAGHRKNSARHEKDSPVNTSDSEKQNHQNDVQQQYTVPKQSARMNATHIYGVLMEPVNANYTRNIYFTVKTTHKYYRKRLFPLMLTWLQVVDKNKVSHNGFAYKAIV